MMNKYSVASSILLLSVLAATIDAKLEVIPTPKDFHNETRPPLTGGIKSVSLGIEAPGNVQPPSMYHDQFATVSVSVELLPNSSDSLYVEIFLPHQEQKNVAVCLPYGPNNTIVCNGTKSVFHPEFKVFDNKRLIEDTVHVSFNGSIVPQLLLIPVNQSESNSSDVTCETNEVCSNSANATCSASCTDLPSHAACIPQHCTNLINATCVGPNCLNWTDHMCSINESCSAARLDNSTCIPLYCKDHINGTCIGSKCLNLTDNMCTPIESCPCVENKTECFLNVQRTLNESYTVNVTEDGHAVYLVFNRIAVNSSVTPGHINIKFPVLPEQVGIGGDYTFKTYVSSDWLGDDESNSESVHIKGTVLNAKFKNGGPYNILEAGDEIDFKMEISHGSSEEDAAQVSVSVVQHHTDLVSANITFGSPLQTHILTAANMTNVLIPQLPLGENIVINAKVTVPDDAPNSGGSMDVDVRYYPAGRLDLQSYGSDTQRYAVLKPTIDSGLSEVTVSEPWSPGQIVTQVVTFTVPKGTTRGVALDTAFTSTDPLLVDKVRFVASSIEAPPYIKFADPTVVEVTESSITRSLSTQSRRKRRSTTFRLDTKRTVGNFVNPSATGQSNTPIVMMNLYVLDPSAAQFAGVPLQMADSSLTMSGQTAALLSAGLSTYTGVPKLEIIKTRQLWESSPRPQTVRFNVTVRHTNESTAPAYDVTITDLIPYHDIDYSSYLTPSSLGTPNFMYDETNTAFLWKVEELGINDTLHLSYKAVPKNKGKDLPTNNTDYLAQVVYYSADTATAVPGYVPITYGPDIVGVCLYKKVEEKSNVVLDHGFTALSFFVAAIVGILLILLLMFLYLRCTEGTMFGQVKPQSQADLQGRRGRKLILDGGASAGKVGKNGWSLLKDNATVSVEESIVCILSSNDKVQTQRDLDSLDILNTIQIDTDIENERNRSSVNTTVGLVSCLRHNQDISPKVEKTTVERLHVDVKTMERKLEVEFKIMLEEVFKSLSFKNKHKLQTLNVKQETEKKELRTKTQGISAKEKKELMKLLSDQHHTEQDELTYLLKLEQDEESEKLRKEFAIKRRMQLQQVQTDFLRGVIDQGKLSQEQADWLMKEHRSNQARSEKIYDDEISRQRMVLEEKLARRKQLAEANEKQEDDESELLNTLAGQQIQTVNKMKKQGVLDQDEVDVYIEQIKTDMIEAKNRHDQEKARQALELHKRLSEKKKARIAAKQKEQETEIVELNKKQQAQQTEGAVDPISLLEAKMCVMSQHRNELSQLENEIDKEQAKELEKLIDDLTVKTKTEIEQSGDAMVSKLKNNGADSAALDKILKQHDKAVEELRSGHEESRLQQEEKFKAQLAKRRREWAQRREEEKQEQAKIREHDSNVVNKLIDNQVAMSEDERNRIMQEHEKQMVKLENSLTLNKLQQQRMLGEKLAAKKKQQMEKLQKKQVTEVKKQEKSQARNVDDEDEDEQHAATLILLKKQAEQRLDVLKSESVNYGEEMEAIKEEMIKERAISLKDQEERLGAMMANLQMEKAREMAKIEEQQKAISDLKANLMDDLNDRGVLSDPQCKKVIERHQEETEKLNQKLDNQRTKQEKALRSRLEEKLLQRENTMVHAHEAQLKNILENVSNKTAAKLRQMALLHKQKMQMEEFRQRMEKQINQNIQEMRRQQDLKKMRVTQEKELQFIAGLVRIGRLKREELISVLSLLFPGRSNDDLEAILQKIYDSQNDEEEDDDENDMLNASSASMLESRIKSARFSRVKPTGEETPPKRRKKRKGSTKTRKTYSADEDAFEPNSSLPPLRYRSIAERADPDGAYSDDIHGDDDGRKTLPPLKPKTGKKKRKSIDPR